MKRNLHYYREMQTILFVLSSLHPIIETLLNKC